MEIIIEIFEVVALVYFTCSLNANQQVIGIGLKSN